MAGLGVRIGRALLADFIGYLLFCGIRNKIKGKTIFGKPKKSRDGSYVDWKGNIHVGPNDGWVV